MGATIDNVIALVVGLGIALAATNLSAGPVSDAEASKGIVGSWIVPSSSSDYGPFNRYAVETYKSDGSGVAVFYTDQTCKAVVHTMTEVWTIHNGIMVTVLANGVVQRDVIVSLDASNLTDHSLDDGTTFTRVRGTICAPPAVS